MTSPTATARPWATPVRAPRRDPAKKRGHGPGRRVPVCATHPPKAGSVSQISVSTRHRQISASARHRRPVRASDLRPRVSTRQRPVRAGGIALGGGQRRRGGDQPAEPGFESTAGRCEAVLANAADVAARPLVLPGATVLGIPCARRCRRRCSASAGRGRSAGPSARRRPRGLSPAAGPTRCATRRSVRRRSATARGGSPVRSTGSRDAVGRRPGGRDARRAGQAAPFAKPLTRTQGRDPDRRGRGPAGPLYGGATASAGSRAGRSTGTVRRWRPLHLFRRPSAEDGGTFRWQLFDAGGCPLGDERRNRALDSYESLPGTRRRRLPAGRTGNRAGGSGGRQPGGHRLPSRTGPSW